MNRVLDTFTTYKLKKKQLLIMMVDFMTGSVIVLFVSWYKLVVTQCQPVDFFSSSDVL